MASELILILSDFFSDTLSATADHAAPRLAGLETLLAKSRRGTLPRGWRGWLADRIATPEIAALAPAALVARVWLSPGGAKHWLATPVHYFAGLDSVQLHPEGLLQLSAQEQAALVADFEVVFADTPWRLHANGARELLLSGPPLDADGAEPAQFAGLDPSGGLPRGAELATLRRLGVEIEMWLHEHRVNQERRARGELPVSALWFWGASAQLHASSAGPALSGAGGPLRLYGRDTYAQALWRLCALESASLPADLGSALEAEASAHLLIIPTLDAHGPVGALQRLEAHWLAPALRGLRARRLSGIQLLAGTRFYELRRLHLARFWRALAPWTEQMA
ncbi:MAG: hypothetical protein ABSF96_08230 [Steroidobacteraceae bacterium]